MAGCSATSLKSLGVLGQSWKAATYSAADKLLQTLCQLDDKTTLQDLGSENGLKHHGGFQTYMNLVIRQATLVKGSLPRGLVTSVHVLNRVTR